MLTIAPMASADYYLSQMASHHSIYEYYQAGNEPDGKWWNPSGMLGLTDQDDIESTAFERLRAGLSPEDGTPLTRNANLERRSAGLDLTFSPDKSVSVLWAIADTELRQQIEACHEDAVRWTLENLFRKHCAYTRRGAGGREVVPGDIIAATFTHHESRENDPQIHTHCTLFNVVKTHDDGKWRTLYQLPVFKWVRAGGAVYRLALAWHLRERLGLHMERYGQDGEFTRIAGVPEDLKDAFSKRTHEIERTARQLGISPSKDVPLAKEITLATRKHKDSRDPEERDAAWREEAALYVDREALIEEILAASVTRPTQQQVREVIRACGAIPNRLTIEEAVFSIPQVLEKIAQHGAGVLSPEALDTALVRVLRDASVIALDGHRKGLVADANAGLTHTRLYSTLDYAAEETAVHAAAKRSREAGGYAIPAEDIDRHIETLTAQGFPIGPQQKAAVHHLAGGDTSIAAVLGAAGSGKTVALRPVTELYRAHGYRIIATALSWPAAVNLGTACEAQPSSIARLFSDVSRGRLVLDRSSVLLVDEAGMLSVRQMRTLLDIAERAGAKVLLVGDLDQIQPFEAGPGLRLIVDELEAARIDTIRRQRPDLEDLVAWRDGIDDPEQARAQVAALTEAERTQLLAQRDAYPGQGWQAEASEAVRKGNAGAAIDAYAARGRITLGYDFDNTVMRLGQDWNRHRLAHPDATRLVIARTNKEVHRIGQVLRALHHPTDIPRPSVTITTSTGQPGERKTEALEIAQGDLIRVGATVWQHMLFNGTVLSVERIERVVENTLARPLPEHVVRRLSPDAPDAPIDRVRIEATTDDKRRITFYVDEIRDYFGNVRLDYGYATTIARAQGLTADQVFFLADDHPDRETVYPAMTRHRDHLHIYADMEPLQVKVRRHRNEEDWGKDVTPSDIHKHLACAWSRKRPKEAAFDYASPGLGTDIEARVADEEARRSARHLADTLREQRPTPEGLDVPEGIEGRVLARLTHRAGAFTVDDVRRELFRERVQLVQLDDLARHVLADPRVMALYGHDSTSRLPRYTTVETFALEEQLTRLAARLHADTASHPAPPGEHHIARAVQGLDGAAETAARSLLHEGRLNVVTLASDRTRGAVLQSAIRACNRAGTHVLACGPSGQSFRAYGNAPAAQHTVYGLIRQLERGRSLLQRTSVVIVNDADALDTETLHTLTRLTDEARVRLVLVGDPRDNSHSPGFAWLAEHCASSTVAPAAPDHLPTSVREHLAGAPDTYAVLKHLDSSGHLLRLDDQEAVSDSVVRAWIETEAAHPDDTQLVLTSSAPEAARANLAIQAARADAGRLGASQRYDVLRPAYASADTPGASAGATARAGATTESLTVHVGDRLRILESHRESGLASGDVGTVLSVSRRRIRLDVDGKVLNFDPVRHNRFALGYASSIYRRPSPTDHVHATVTPGWSQPLFFRAAAAHSKSLTVHSRTTPGQTVEDIARSIDTRTGPACSQSYTERQHALHAAHAPDTNESTLRTAWQLLSADDQDRIQREDRDQRGAIHAYQRGRDTTPSWLRTASAPSIAEAIGMAFRYRSEGAAALDYQYQFDVLNAELAAVRDRAVAQSSSAYDDAHYPEALHRLRALAETTSERIAASPAFRFALQEKTRFTAQDLDRHREDCAHELRAHHIHTETRNMSAYFYTRVRAWSLSVNDALDDGRDLSATAKAFDTRAWFLDDYPDWHARVEALESDREALSQGRANLTADHPDHDLLIRQFDAAAARLAKALHHHNREVQTHELVTRYVEAVREHKQVRAAFYRQDSPRAPASPDARAAMQRADERVRALAAEIHAELHTNEKWVSSHLERASVTLREIRVLATPSPDTDVTPQQRTQAQDRDQTL